MKQQFFLCCILPDVALGTTIPTPSPEPRDDPPSCFSCSESSQSDGTEVRITLLHLSPYPKRSEITLLLLQDSEHSSDDLSSGVFSSCNSRRDGRADWLLSANQPSLYSSSGERAQTGPGTLHEGVLTVASCRAPAGVDIWIENVQGECVRIRERREIKVGHVAIGISDKVRVAADG